MASKRSRVQSDSDSEGPVADPAAFGEYSEPDAKRLRPDTAQMKNTVTADRRYGRIVVFASRGINSAARHLMADLRSILPHHKTEGKLDDKKALGQLIPEVMDLKSANGALFIEMRKREHAYLWAVKDGGPSAKFAIHGIHTLNELRLPGNCIKGSRPLIHFDPSFASAPHLQTLQKLLTVLFSTPRGAPRSRPFVDHIICFFHLNGNIFFRHYQIAEQSAAKHAPLDATAITKGIPEASLKRISHDLLEIGPRFTLTPIRIFSGPASGETLWANESYLTPTAARVAAKKDRVELAKSRRATRSVHAGRLTVPTVDEDADAVRETLD